MMPAKKTNGKPESQPENGKESKSGKSSGKKVTLRVAEAMPKDVGRGVARIDPEVMEGHGMGVGDIILIKGKQETPARIFPTYSEYRGKGLIQIDGIMRENAKVGIDDKISR